jgi:hypothetical protein
MDRTATQKQQGDVWSWIVIALMVGAVTAALYVPLLWELMRSA